jgi:hypothetical protein
MAMCMIAMVRQFAVSPLSRSAARLQRVTGVPVFDKDVSLPYCDG